MHKCTVTLCYSFTKCLAKHANCIMLPQSVTKCIVNYVNIAIIVVHQCDYFNNHQLLYNGFISRGVNFPKFHELNLDSGNLC